MKRLILSGLSLLLLAGSAHAAGLADPMLPPGGHAETPGEATPAVKGGPALPIVRTTAQGPRVWLHDRWWKVGDELDGARITAITPHAIELRRDGERESIPLLPTVRQPLPRR
jgi:hypothetical protein